MELFLRKSRDGAVSVDWSLGSPSPQPPSRAHSVAGSNLSVIKDENKSTRSTTSHDSRRISTEEVWGILKKYEDKIKNSWNFQYKHFITPFFFSIDVSLKHLGQANKRLFYAWSSHVFSIQGWHQNHIFNCDVLTFAGQSFNVLVVLRASA